MVSRDRGMARIGQEMMREWTYSTDATVFASRKELVGVVDATQMTGELCWLVKPEMCD